MGGLGMSVTAFTAFTKGHPVPTTTRFLVVWVSVLGALGGLAIRGMAPNDGLMFSGLEHGPEGMYAMAFGSGRSEERLALTWACEAGDFLSARLLRLVSRERGPLGRVGCCGRDKGVTLSKRTLLLEATAFLRARGILTDTESGPLAGSK